MFNSDIYGNGFLVKCYFSKTDKWTSFIKPNREFLWKFLNDGYKMAGYESFKGCDDSKHLIKNPNQIKIAFADNVIIAVSVYTGYAGGYKCVGITATTDPEYRDVGKRAVEKIIQMDVCDFDRFYWCEASGSVEKMFKKNGGIAIPNTYAEMMIGGVRVLDEDGFHYERMIGNDMENKMIFGFNDIETFELIKKEHEGYILRCIEKIHQLYPNGRVDLISESDGDEPGVKNYLVCAKETVNVFVRMWYEWGTHEFSEKSLKILKKNLNIIQTAIEKNIIPNGFSHSFERAFAYGNEVASSSTILQFHKFQ